MAIQFGFISTFPPTQCGLATFTASLLRALTASGEDHGRVARLLEAAQAGGARDVVADIVHGDAATAAHSMTLLNDCDVVIVQHEFGIYGGRDGADVMSLLEQLTVPTIVVLHTVLAEPTTHQRQVMEAVAHAATALVTMTVTARDRLAAGYQVDMDKVSIIPHGAPEESISPARLKPVFRNGQATVLTWGLLGPGKGIEWGIEAMSQLQDISPAPRYHVAGHTHPKVALREGEAYRDSLGRQIQRLALNGVVQLDGRYRDAPSLVELVSAADVVLLPYDSTDQVTSGVLIEAVAACKPVVATQFPHAVELLSGGAGIVVPHRDPTAIANALRVVLTQRDVAASMSDAARVAAPELRWSVVAQKYRELATRLIANAAVVAA
jgi:glycosyltransferase involved in cell wall biosynthesis